MTESPVPTFLGYRRGQGRPGIRNALLVLNITGLTAPSARRISRDLVGSLLVSMDHGAAINGRGEAPVEATLESLARHPNVGAVLILSAHRGKAQALLERLSDDDRPAVAVTLDDANRDALEFRLAAVRAGAQLMARISTQRREALPWSDLMLALECGMSDPTSGLVANPLLGLVTDRLIAAGGAAVFGETTEWLGCEGHLAERAATPEIAARIRQAVHRRETLARDGGMDLIGNNPNDANIASGLTTIEDKAIGSVAKSGSAPITTFLDYGERLQRPGLAAMDGPSYTPESLTGLVAAGAQIALFTSGVGNSFVNRLAPTLKITANAETAAKLPVQFDFCCAEALTQPDKMAATVDALVARIVEVASGALTFGEILGEDDEVVARFGETL
ncbi:UxaA family hydrolase [Frigidibacter sp. ROC022]|uniref:UxaA family hydrolase n=1 Tax=Frigidibacter sp. ROC022 TaxID=2971796 RepID=UPI00215AE638|nr:UxaA family hydrolase [Frigidibacter sp. ROC022]